jgi:predicted dehydrogenase
MTYNILIVGLGGIGQVYKNALADYHICTLDANDDLEPTYTHFNQINKTFDVAIIATPNYLHYQHALDAGKIAKIVIVEKPGVLNALEWALLCNQHSRTLLVKNNQYRDNIAELCTLAQSAHHIRLNWLNNQRIPNPGSWFTNITKSFGGVERDLVPHLLSYLLKFFSINTLELTSKQFEQRWTLDQIIHTNYGQINHNGVYNVNDYAYLQFNTKTTKIEVTANWDVGLDDIALYFDDTRIQLDLCPDTAYRAMVLTAIANLDNTAFWQQQHKEDIWIHKLLEH